MMADTPPAAAGAAQTVASADPPPLEEVRVIVDEALTNYTVNCYIYAEAPDRMVVTCRGTGGGKPALWKVCGLLCQTLLASGATMLCSLSHSCLLCWSQCGL